MAQKGIRENKGIMFFIAFILVMLEIVIFNSFDSIELPLSLVILAVVGLLMMADDQQIKAAKMDSAKLICNEISNSIVPEFKVDLGNDFVAYGLGAFRTDFFGSSTGTDGIIIIHKPMIEYNGFSMNVQGEIMWQNSQNLSKEKADKIKKYFGYIPDTILRVKPNVNSLKKIKEYSDVLEVDKAYKYVSDLIAENETLQKRNRFVETTLGEMGHTVTKLLDKSSGYIKTAGKSKVVTPGGYSTQKIGKD